MLKDLVYELKEVDWYQLGVQLDVPVHILNNIDRENFSEPRKLSKVLQYWIDNAKPVASWNTIVRALQRIGGHKSIIAIIQSKYMPPVASSPGPLRTRLMSPVTSQSIATSSTNVPTLSVAEEDVHYMIDGILSLVNQLVRLPSELHDRPCADVDLDELSDYIEEYEDWKELYPFLHLSPPVATSPGKRDAKESPGKRDTKESPGKRDAKEMLKEWKNTFGERANYR